MKVANFDVALRMVNCGPGWKVMTFENPMKHALTVRLMHVDGYAEEMALAHEELFDNPVGVMQMVTGWIRQRTKAEEPVPQAAVTVVTRPAVIPKPTQMAQAEVKQAMTAAERTRIARPVRTRLITLDE